MRYYEILMYWSKLMASAIHPILHTKNLISIKKHICFLREDTYFILRIWDIAVGLASPWVWFLAGWQEADLECNGTVEKLGMCRWVSWQVRSVPVEPSNGYKSFQRRMEVQFVESFFFHRCPIFWCQRESHSEVRPVILRCLRGKFYPVTDRTVV